MEDAVIKRRMARRYGETNSASKYSEDEIRLVFTLRASGLSQMAISKKTGISQTHISRILLRKNWSHLRIY